MYDQMMYSKWARDYMKTSLRIGNGPQIEQWEEEDPPRWHIFQIAFMNKFLVKFVFGTCIFVVVVVVAICILW